ncbi:hypothetical protein TWF694_004177 [Orbilia ellipsospora]|uniref:Uncharacterized protein n=1 Tax=Orbilia ellipsospora TaxID=2528407 RepID=A0AAV9WYB5_9PEZI
MNHVCRSAVSVGIRQWATLSSTRTSLLFHRLPQASRINSQLQSLQSRRNFWSKLFGRKKASKEVNPEDAKFIYPESLCLYSAGRRTVYVGCMKLISCYPFLMTIFYLGPNLELSWPSLYTFPLAAEYPRFTALSIATLTALPMGMFYLAAPYITHMYVRIPPYARVSKKAVIMWAKSSITKDTKLRIFTMRWLGRPKLVEVPLGELRFCKKRMGCVNLEWRYTQKEKPRVTDFYVERSIGAGRVRHEVFYEIMSMVEQQTMGKVVGEVGELKSVTKGATSSDGNPPVIKFSKKKASKWDNAGKK